jgi:NAD(P)-dependent dehydrogenase (short-subunit alcohol dehydrogenase family)
MNWTPITGAGCNLGAEIAVCLAEHGHNILIHYNRSLTRAEEVAKSCRIFGVRAEIIQGDFSTRQRVEAFATALLSQLCDVKIVINNMGNYLKKSASETSIEEWEEIFQSNLFTPIALNQALIPSVIKLKGNVINIETSGISLKANPINIAYISAKRALLLFTKTLAKQLAPWQVETSVIEVKGIPMGRDATFKDVNRVILFLLKKSNRYLTRQNIEVASGLGL